MNIYLTGYRCTGKTTLGRKLAGHLGREFIDADAELVRRAGRTVAEIVASGGWPAFRKMEREVIADLCGRAGLVAATGGGAVLDADNRADLRRSGKVIWLDAGPETVLSRMKTDPATNRQRPALTDAALETEVRRTLAERAPLYAEAARFRLSVDDLSPAEALCGLRHLLGDVPRRFWNAPGFGNS
ncbi:MAG: shikimate kinase [Desulfobacterales bacterium]|nr:MAG: shikimate kinase [Desulfobacterales bacterium]